MRVASHTDRRVHMRTLGLLGGMSWLSTAEYYRITNEEVSARLGGSHSADLIIRSFEFHAIEELQRTDWGEAARLLAEAAVALVESGAEALMICTNAMHKVADRVEQEAGVPLLHIADALAATILADGHETVALLGAKYTMLGEYYVGRLREQGLEVIVPDEEDRTLIDDVIFTELVRGVFDDESRAEYVRIIEQLRREGATATILGCTEIPLLVSAADTDAPLYDSTHVHALAGVEWMLGESGRLEA
jgi:aspartate racemase